MGGQTGANERTVSVRLLRCRYYGHEALPCQMGSGNRTTGGAEVTSFRTCEISGG